MTGPEMGRVAGDGGFAAGPLYHLLWLGVRLMASHEWVFFLPGAAPEEQDTGPLWGYVTGLWASLS